MLNRQSSFCSGRANDIVEVYTASQNTTNHCSHSFDGTFRGQNLIECIKKGPSKILREGVSQTRNVSEK